MLMDLTIDDNFKNCAETLKFDPKIQNFVSKSHHFYKNSIYEKVFTTK